MVTSQIDMFSDISFCYKLVINHVASFNSKKCIVMDID